MAQARAMVAEELVAVTACVPALDSLGDTYKAAYKEITTQLVYLPSTRQLEDRTCYFSVAWRTVLCGSLVALL